VYNSNYPIVALNIN